MVNPSVPVVPGIPNYGLPGAWPGRPYPDDLHKGHFMPGDYYPDPCTAVLDPLLVCPRGFYAIITHYACRITPVAVPINFCLTLEVIPAGCDAIYPIVGIYGAMNAAAEGFTGFQSLTPIVLDEGDTLYRRINTDIPTVGGFRVVFVNKGGEQV